MEIIRKDDLRIVPMFYKGYSSLKKAVKFESVNYMLRIPTEKEFEGVAITHGVANYLYNKLANLFELKAENVKIVEYNNLYTSMCRDFEVDTNSKFYSMEDINGRFDLSSCMDIYNIMDVCSIIDNEYFNDEQMFLRRFMELVILDFITGNSNRRLNGYGLLVSHRTFVDIAPVFGGACSFGSGLKLETINSIINNYDYERRARTQEFNFLRYNNERIAPYSFIVKDKGVSYEIINHFTKVNESSIYTMIDGIPIIDDNIKEYIINSIIIRLDMLRTI